MKSLLFAFLMVCAPAIGSDASPQNPKTPADFAQAMRALFALDRPAFNGGFDTADLGVAEQIRAALQDRYPPMSCGKDTYSGRSGDDSQAYRDGLMATLAKSDPDLATLAHALYDPRLEIREVAAYAFGLVGSSAGPAETILEDRFNDRTLLPNGWSNFALARVACLPVVGADFREVIPKDHLPDQSDWPALHRVALVFVAKSFLEPRYEYPPGTLADVEVRFTLDRRLHHLGAVMDEPPVFEGAAVPYLIEILDDDGLSLRKHIEAASVLAHMDPKSMQSALPAFRRNANSRDAELRCYAANALTGRRDLTALYQCEEQLWPRYEAQLARP